ncbi:V-type ATP synthase subunit F [bacterium]|nr:V-type ATP synthase subunit F [bacterium]
MRFYVIGDEETVIGFRLVGISGTVVNNRQDAEAAIRKAREDENLGIILITERIADLVKDIVEELLFTTAFPLILEIPDRNGPLKNRGSVRDIVKHAVGLSV